MADVRDRRNALLKACLFATGCAGIVAEFVLSTLASYLLGNTTLQWTLVMSLMLFSMGLG
ncbi:MAG: spermidine synthase, partial [Candidatus Latescibacteria bacterium]|nr:spermidine synthase [Candidatus Latescibacterota bacterium]